VEDREDGAGAPGSGSTPRQQKAGGGESAAVEGDGRRHERTGRPGGRRRSRRSGAQAAAALAANPQQGNETQGRKRRRRKRGRKVFAADTRPKAERAADGPPQDGAVRKAAAEPVPSPDVKPSALPPLTTPPVVRDLPPLFAALDLGTNNCRLLIAVPGRPGQFRVIDAFSRIVRLGEGLTANGRLSEAAMDRAVEALKVCAEKLRNRSVVRARLIATEACRAAENGVEFLDRVEREAGIRLEIIDRRTEARLAVSGCGPLVERETSGVVLFDIGGGSSEIALLDTSNHRSPRLASHIVSWTSLPAGVVSLSERFGGRNVTREIFEDMVVFVCGMIERFDGRDRVDHLLKSSRFHLLGTSGTVTTLAGVHLGLERYDRRRVDGLWMDRENVDRMVETILSWDFGARVANPCIGADRADLVLAGCAILEAIRRFWPAERLRVADRGLREGILSELMADAGVWRRRGAIAR